MVIILSHTLPGKGPIRRYRGTFSSTTHLSSCSKNVDFVELHRQLSDCWSSRHILVFLTITAPCLAQNSMAFSAVVQMLFLSSSSSSKWSIPLSWRSTLTFHAKVKLNAAIKKGKNSKNTKCIATKVWCGEFLWSQSPSHEIPTSRATTKLRIEHSMGWPEMR